MATSADTVRISRLQAVATVIVATVLFLVIVGLVGSGLGDLLRDYAARALRAHATVTITGSAVGELIVIALLIVYLGRRGHSLRDFGLWRAAPVHGWIIASLVTAIFVWVTFGALRGHAALTEVSVFHIYNSLLAGLVAGFVEESFFRGFVMSELRWGGFGGITQVIVSGVLFGIAHSGWGLFSSHLNWSALVGSVIATMVLGWGFALAYLASRRSLMPVIAGHLIMDCLIEPWLVLTAVSAATGQPH